MDEVPLVPLTLNNIQALTYSLPSTSLHQPGQETIDQVASDIDWVSFLSASPFIFGNEKPSSTSESLTAENGGRGENRTRNKGKASRTKKVNPSRIAFHTRSIDDILDDGYRWRKYGQKAVKNSNHPRSYYRCTQLTCNVKKQIQRLSKDSSIVVTTYEGIHNHPSEKLMESLSPLLRQLQFLSRI
ncbi:probable WRKY transcription factor 43 [Quercus suber]|uniref:probable WRKY transcription factor 43 n=1 Tax=Quercus suber TaxID=58331 RepID=UPI000CE24D1F|nr:probable WRKY transcription factor 43 [Quercus suber]POE88765.1 putative wrky transcription factor 56 [Quercus suber]